MIFGMNMLKLAESRQFNYMQLSCAISYKFPDSEQSFEGVCLNISGSGIFFRGSHMLESGIALEMSVANKNDLCVPLRAYVEVIRSKEVEGKLYEVATEIKGIREY